ncbi:MAG TPA: DNA starvation/stationary phase protection protein [Elusimicrobiota bacterium]|nr:DNA starvation/stationary phase protection protein [Elusimicrobiota bacterium]
MNAALGLKESSRAKVLAFLDLLLADEYVLYTKTRNFHWNVVGPDFNDKHKLFEAQYETLDGHVDSVAERSRALGGRALGSLKEFLGAARLKEAHGRTLKSGVMVAELLRDHETLIRGLREDVEETARLGDAGTSDFLTGLLEEHEKMAWMLRSIAA